jgi:hypothetical protein
MFVTNRRVKLPKEITVDSKNVNNKLIEIKVSVVTSFKLLGVTIDNKLTFTEHCSNVKKIVNWKMYSIKRLFYLCTSVKIQFFKTFILPYFDSFLPFTHYLFSLSSVPKFVQLFQSLSFQTFQF